MAMRASEALVHFGFTALEAEIYAFLLTESPATGYRVSQAIGKPAANTYKALESLERKAAIVLEEGSSKSYRPVAPDSLLSRVGKEFERNRTSALKVLKVTSPILSTGKLVSLTTRESVLGHALEILSSAKETAVIIASDEYIAALNFGAISSSVDTWVMTTSEELDVPDATIIALPEEAFDSETLQIVVDRSAAVWASDQGGGQGLQGFTVKNHSLIPTLHQSVICQMGLYQVDRKLEEDAGRKQIAKVIENLP